MTKLDNPIDLKIAIERQHGGTATFVEPVIVDEKYQGKQVWKGVVHVFTLAGHPNTNRAYAWSEPIEGSDKRQVFTVLHIPPAVSPLEAVRISIVERHRRAIPKFNEDAVSRALRNLPGRKDRE